MGDGLLTWDFCFCWEAKKKNKNSWSQVNGWLTRRTSSALHFELSYSFWVILFWNGRLLSKVVIRYCSLRSRLKTSYFLATRRGNRVRASFPLLAGEVTYYYPSPSCPLHNLIFSCDNALWKEIHWKQRGIGNFTVQTHLTSFYDKSLCFWNE